MPTLLSRSKHEELESSLKSYIRDQEERRVENIRNKKKKEDAGCRLEAGTNGTVMNSEAKIHYVGIFAIIAKMTMHSENLNFLYA